MYYTKRSLSTAILLILSIAITLCSLIITIVAISRAVSFSANCKQKLETAVNTTSVTTAKENLSATKKYLEDNNLTTGHTHIFIKSDGNSLAVFYARITEAIETLEELTEDADNLTRTNALMNVKDALTDSKGVIVPRLISVYPAQQFFLWSQIIGWLVAVVLWFAFLVRVGF